MHKLRGCAIFYQAVRVEILEAVFWCVLRQDIVFFYDLNQQELIAINSQGLNQQIRVRVSGDIFWGLESAVPSPRNDEMTYCTVYTFLLIVMICWSSSLWECIT